MSSTHTKGFTLIELMVSVSIFSMVMVMAMGSILSVLDANRKSNSLRVIMDDMNYTLEGMSRTIRFGTNYRCDSSAIPTTLDCTSTPGTAVTFLSSDNSTYITYQKSGTSITKTVVPSSGVASTYTLTSPDVNIQNLSFWVIGSNTSDGLQPRVVIVVSGTAGQSKTQSSFNLQTTVSERKLDYHL